MKSKIDWNVIKNVVCAMIKSKSFHWKKLFFPVEHLSRENSITDNLIIGDFCNRRVVRDFFIKHTKLFGKLKGGKTSFYFCALFLFLRFYSRICYSKSRSWEKNFPRLQQCFPILFLTMLKDLSLNLISRISGFICCSACNCISELKDKSSDLGGWKFLAAQ